MKDWIQLTMGCGHKFYRRASRISAIKPSYGGWFFRGSPDGSTIEIGNDDYYVLETPDEVLALIQTAESNP